jgi:hypothetical protein
LETSAQNKSRPVHQVGSAFEVDFDCAAGCGFDFVFEFVRAFSPIVLGEPRFFALSKDSFTVRTEAKKDVGAISPGSPRREGQFYRPRALGQPDSRWF